MESVWKKLKLKGMFEGHFSATNDTVTCWFIHWWVESVWIKNILIWKLTTQKDLHKYNAPIDAMVNIIMYCSNRFFCFVFKVFYSLCAIRALLSCEKRICVAFTNHCIHFSRIAVHANVFPRFFWFNDNCIAHLLLLIFFKDQFNLTLLFLLFVLFEIISLVFSIRTFCYITWKIYEYIEEKEKKERKCF